MSKSEGSKMLNNQILSFISKDVQEQIENLFNKMDKDKEFEVIFFSKKGYHMNKEKYILMLKYIRTISKYKKLKVTGPHRTLDINYTLRATSKPISESILNTTSESILNATSESTPELTSESAQDLTSDADPDQTYRIAIEGSQEINKYINRIKSIQNKNYVIYKFLLQLIKKNYDNDKNIGFMLKTKNDQDTIDVDDLSMRIRLSGEKDLLAEINKKSSIIDSNIIKLVSGEKIDLELRKQMNKNIIFRLKERTSLYIEEDDNHFIRIDLTDTKNTNDIRKLNTMYSNYELEIEYGVFGNKKNDKKYLMKIYETSETLLKLLQQSSFLISNKKTDEIINYYKDLMGITDKINNLVARQPVSLEIQHVTEILPNRYAVTDKADGDRYFLIIYKNAVYLISSNLNVKDTGILLDDSLTKYNGSIIDGEYIYISSEKRHLYMAFDCLRNGDKDMRSTISLKQRINEADDIIQNCFIFDGQSGFTFKEQPILKNEFEINEMTKFYTQEINKFYNAMNNDMREYKLYPLIRRKFFMAVSGAKNWEIFKYSVEYWKRYTEDSNVKIPYNLDGLIYHPLEQSYNVNAAESKYHEFKWKPPTKNSIDFYIEFKRDQQTGKILDVYDNSNEDDVRNQTYKICTLYVGKSVKNKEQPVPFDQNYGISEVYLYNRDGETRDMNDDIISDKTVVEFYYHHDPNIIPQKRWIPIKTRYDKTESVERYGRRYGNYIGIAERVWRSIINPVLMNDFIELAKGNTDKRNFYDIKIKEMNSKISHQLIVAVNRENKYYQKQTKLASTMRQYHNFIKSNLIYTYCNKMYQSNIQQSVLDIGCGRGGDIGKFYYTEVAYYIGIDIDAEGFKSPVDGAISRYNRFKKEKTKFS